MKGTWKKYEADSKIDLKKMRKDLKGAFPTCELHLMGVTYIADGTMSGDIHIFYDENGKPRLWIKYTQMLKEEYGIGVNGEFHYNASARYLGLVLPKMRELDTQNKYLDKLTQMYMDYKTLLRLSRKKELSNGDLIFLYSQYYREDTSLAKDILDGKTKNHRAKRNVQKDYEQMETMEEKVAFIKTIVNLYYYREIKFNDPEPLIQASAQTGFSALEYASKELLEDENFIIKAIMASEESNIGDLASRKLAEVLPSHYFSNAKVMSIAFARYPSLLSDIGSFLETFGEIHYYEWIPDSSQEFMNAMKDLEFQRVMLQSILYGLLKSDFDFKLNLNHMERQLIGYFDRELLKNQINTFYGPFEEEAKDHENHERLVFVQKSIQKFSELE